MQMRKMYHTTDKKKRAEEHRKAEQEAANAGFWDSANVNSQMAALLDPYVDPEYA